MILFIFRLSEEKLPSIVSKTSAVIPQHTLMQKTLSIQLLVFAQESANIKNMDSAGSHCKA